MEEEFSIGYWIKRRRKALDMTQKDLANRVGCALITIAKIEADERKPSQEIAGLLAEHLQIPEEQRSLFVQILRGLKSALQLRKMTVADHQPVPLLQAVAIPTVSSLDTEKLRSLELIGKISRSKMVGRSTELAIARNLWNMAKTGASQALLLQGEAGIGKSRLAQELIFDVKAGGGQVLIGECFSEGGMPYGPILRILQNETSLPTELPTVAIADLKAIAPQLAVHYSYIPANPPLDPHAEQSRLFESIYTYFRSYYEKKPLLILIEDIHWADHGSISLLQSLMHRFKQMNAQILMVLTTRDLSPAASPALNSLLDDLLRSRLSTTIHLDRLDVQATRELLAAIFAQDVSDEFIQLIQHETQGNPFFIEEVCKDLVESNQIYWDQGRWERKELTELRVPQNVRTAIQIRLDKLGKETHELLQTASAIGRRFEYDVLRDITAQAEDILIDRLEAAQEAQLLQEVESPARSGEFEFSHGLIASVLREGMSAPRRRIVHKRIMAAIEKIHPNDFGVLAYHAREAAENEATASYFHKAGDQAMRAFAHEDAIRFYSEALNFAASNSPEACQILLARAKVYDLRGERSLQLADLEAAEEKAATTQDATTRAAVALAGAEYAIQGAELNDVIEHAQRAIALAEPAGLSTITAQAYMLWGRALSESGDLNEARIRLVEAGRIGHEAGLGLIEARSMINLGNVDYRLGDYISARDKYLGSLGTIRRLGERRIECMVINNLGNVYWTQGDLEAAVRSYEETLEIARDIGDRLNQARALSNIASILTEQYQYREALQLLEQARPLLHEVEQLADEGVVFGHLADVMEALGRYEEAYKFKTEAVELARKIDDPQSEAEFLSGLSRIETFRKHHVNAEQSARLAISIAQDQGYRVEEAGAWQMLGFAYATAEKFAEAEEAYSKALELSEGLSQGSKSTELHAELAWLANERGDKELAHKHVHSFLPNHDADTLKNIQQPATCWCCYQVLEPEAPQAASLLLETGYSRLQQTAKKIDDSQAREHYLHQLPHHAALIDAWKSRPRK